MDVRVFLVFCLLHFAQSKVMDFSCSQIREFVNGHNNRRLQLAKGEILDQPAATEMKYMIWDNALAAKASDWASNNVFTHNPDKNDYSGRFETGENMFMTSSTDLKYKLNIDSALTSWFDEHKYYTYAPLKKSDFRSSKKAIGHYTQMVWSDSIYVGCGASEFIKNNKKVYIVVCNYGPTGNYYGQTPYKAGYPSGELICFGNCKRAYGNQC